MSATAPRRLLPVFLITLLVIFTTAYYVASLKDAVPSPRDLVSAVGEKIKGISGDEIQEVVDQQPSVPSEIDNLPVVLVDPQKEQEEAKQSFSDAVLSFPEYHYDTEATPESEKGDGSVGKHYHIRPSSPTKEKGFQGCEYPIVIHTTPDRHCTGALALYASIVRNTLTQPEGLQGKVCVHFTYVDPSVKTLEEMYQWLPRENPFPEVADCALVDKLPAMNYLVPVRWHALTPIDIPSKMEVGVKHWLGALNKVHSWAFDLYPRILILDVDSFILTDLHNIFRETPTDITVSGPPDQFQNCHDRNRINGGMILLGRPGRYFHTVMAELLQDANASCLSGHWDQSEQELLNCFCGYNYDSQPVLPPPRPEFTCRMMPIYNSVWPKNYGCSDVNVQPMRSIHFTAVTKPWNVPEDKLDTRWDTGFFKCIRDGGRRDDPKELALCSIPDLEETRKFKDDIPKAPNVEDAQGNQITP